MVLLLLPSNAYSALIEKDWHTLGDGLITYDSRTDLEWLDLTQTSALSWDFVSQQFGNTGSFAGFRYATLLEIRGLFQSASIPKINQDSALNLAPVHGLLNLVGTLRPGATASWTIGLSGESPTGFPTVRYTANLETLDYRGIGRANVPLSTQDTNFAGAGDLGSWLVRIAPVPEAETYAMMLAGLGLVGLMAKRRKQVEA